ncbi:MAG: GNAT family N-acetyltransferase [Planctomycetota bacterium]
MGWPVLETDRLALTLPPVAAAERVAAFYERNRAHHAPWSPIPPDGFYTEEYWRAQLQQNREEFEEGASMRLFLFARDDLDGAVLGGCNFTNIVRGPFLSCHLGYQLDEAAVGKGLMQEALGVALPYVFDELGLHRVAANYMPVNERSGRLLRRMGFVVEGYARDYLCIAGEWRDHVLTARYADA